MSAGDVTAFPDERESARHPLDAAWKAAEAGTPGHGVLALRKHSEDDYRATWYRPVGTGRDDGTAQPDEGSVLAAFGATPAEALLALTAQFRAAA